MKKWMTLAAVLAIATPVFCADESALFAKHWQTAKEFTLAVADAMPADRYNSAPNPEEMSFGKLMAHIAMANNNAFALVSGSKAPAPPASLAAAYKDPKGVFDKAATMQFLRDSFAFCTQALSEITPDKLDAMTGPEGHQLAGRERLWAYFTHMAHHRGQAEVYLRVNGIKPPDYRF